MKNTSRAHHRCLALGLFAALLGAPARGADHVDSALTASLSNRLLDITDVYVFRSPVTPANCVIAVNHQSIFDPSGGVALPGATLFATDGVYQTYVDRNGDFVPEITITTTFSGAAPAQTFSISGLTSTPITGTVSPLGGAPVVVVRDGISAFCGPRDDPFFFDLTAFNDFLFNGPYLPAAGIRRAGGGAPANFFQGNVASIVLEIPVTMLTGGTSPVAGNVRIWSKTFRSN